MDQMYLENLDEFVNDESKMVTYKWLSKNLQVHVNQAKQMLYNFVLEQRNKKENDSLCVTYCVAGFKADSEGNKIHTVQIVPEERCDVFKKSLNPVTTCHVYSVQKGKIKDVNNLYTADYDQLKDNLFHSNKFSAITCTTAKVRSAEELRELQSRSANTHEQPKAANGHSNHSNGSASNGTSSHAPEKKKTSPAKKQNAIAGMFAAAGKKKETDTSKDVKKEPETKKPETKAKGKQGGVMSFFANQANKPKAEVKEEPSPSGANSKKEEKSGRGKKKMSDSEGSASDKKRRRIQVWESSSESEEEMETAPPMPSPPPPAPEIKEEEPEIKEEEPEEASPSPSPLRRSPRKSPAKAQEPKPSPQKKKSPTKASAGSSGGGGGQRRRVKKRKVVTKTFVDEDGFMITEKVNEEVSTDASDYEDVIPGKTNKAQASKKSPSKAEPKKKSPKKKSPAKGKQQNIMSFFKKK